MESNVNPNTKQKKQQKKQIPPLIESMIMAQRGKASASPLLSTVIQKGKFPVLGSAITTKDSC